MPLIPYYNTLLEDDGYKITDELIKAEYMRLSKTSECEIIICGKSLYTFAIGSECPWCPICNKIHAGDNAY